jgi:hypothetical protein
MLKLWFYLEGKFDYSFVVIPPDHDISELKEQIHQKCERSLSGFDPLDLTLTKVRYIGIFLSVG